MENFKSTLKHQIGLRLRAARKAAGFKTAKSFSLTHNIPETTYSQYETGKRNISLDILVKYCKLLNINCNWLVMGEGVPLTNNDARQDNVIQQEIYSASFKEPNILNTSEVTKKSFASVDLTIIGKIVGNLVDIVKDKQLQIPHNEMLDFIIDVYNDIIKTTGDNDKDHIIKLSISSLIEKEHDRKEATKKAQSA